MKLLNREYIVAVSKIEKHTHLIKNLNFKTIPNGINYWVADPFPIEVNGELYIFGEIYEYSKLKGSIAYTKYDGNKFTRWKKVIEEPYHLSFPNIFKKDGAIYMCPEAHNSKQLYLYKCLEFPDVWIKDRVLADNVDFSDTVFWKSEEDEQLYGFTCEWKSVHDHSLKVFSMNDEEIEFINGRGKILENYKSRPAGKIFYDEVENRYLMVSQICKPIYGSGLVFKKFSIENDIYEENEIDTVYPSDIRCDIKKKFDGIHTFNMSENYAVVDIIWSRFNIIEKTSRAIKKIRN